MKKVSVIIFLVVFAAGCMTTGRTPTKSLTKVNLISTGMTRQQVQSTLGAKAVVGYKIVDAKTARTEPITVDNPQRTQTIQKNNHTYEVDFYFTHIRQADDSISDDELTPFIFEENRLVAKGWYYLDKLTGR